MTAADIPGVILIIVGMIAALAYEYVKFWKGDAK